VFRLSDCGDDIYYAVEPSSIVKLAADREILKQRYGKVLIA